MLPPLPVQVSVYVVLDVGETDCVPLVALVPVQPFDAVHDVAFVVDQVRVAELPVTIDEAEGVRVRVGAGITLTVTRVLWLFDPPAPVQVRV